MFKKILVANRGEIALRVVRGCRELGISPVAIYSDADRRSLHVRAADEALHIGPALSAESYLRIDRVIDAARACGAEAIHPGYGFLSENADFARACHDAGIVFIGPPPDAIAALGSKLMARRIMESAGVPVVPGTLEPVRDPEDARRVAADVGYPIMLKASAGGGGKGIRLVYSDQELEAALRDARSESASAFGDDAVYIEKFVEQPRHVEVQVLGDSHGNYVHLFERDCSVQRRHQKVIEETPCPILRPEVRSRMTEVAIRAAKAVGYVGAGTVEFLVDKDQNFYFLEVNARLQVEHPITEMVTGIDLVRAQIEVAAGKPLPFEQGDITATGAAIECRIYAEDPYAGFVPFPGPIEEMREPGGPWVRVDGGAYPGWQVPIYYDSLISKLIVWGRTRDEAIARTARALGEYVIRPIRTIIPFHRQVMHNATFRSGRYTTDFIASEFGNGAMESPPLNEQLAFVAAAIAAREDESRRKALFAGANGASRDGHGSSWLTIGRMMATRRS